MEYEKIKQLMEDMGNSKLTSLDIDFPDGTKIRMKKDEKGLNNNEIKNNVEEPKHIVENVSNFNEMKDGNVITSPMVGTVYLKPSPDSNPYVEVGKNLKKGDVVCIVEAMKLMNEIESEFDGEVVEILVNDGETVEYGKPLFVVK